MQPAGQKTHKSMRLVTLSLWVKDEVKLSLGRLGYIIYIYIYIYIEWSDEDVVGISYQADPSDFAGGTPGVRWADATGCEGISTSHCWGRHARLQDIQTVENIGVFEHGLKITIRFGHIHGDPVFRQIHWHVLSQASRVQEGFRSVQWCPMCFVSSCASHYLTLTW